MNKPEKYHKFTHSYCNDILVQYFLLKMSQIVIYFFSFFSLRKL